MNETTLNSIVKGVFLSSIHGIALGAFYILLTSALTFILVTVKSSKKILPLSFFEVKQFLFSKNIFTELGCSKIFINFRDFCFIIFYGVSSFFLLYIVCDGIIRFYPLIISIFFCVISLKLTKRIRSICFPFVLEPIYKGTIVCIYFLSRPLVYFYNVLSQLLLFLKEKIKSFVSKREKKFKKIDKKKFDGPVYVLAKEENKKIFVRKIID